MCQCMLYFMRINCAKRTRKGAHTERHNRIILVYSSICIMYTKSSPAQYSTQKYVRIYVHTRVDSCMDMTDLVYQQPNE